MAVFRVEKSKDYTVMANYHLKDTRLSLKAVGLLSKILSLPDEWEYSIAGLVEICKEGRDAVGSALKELEGAGYIKRRQLHDESGAFAGSEYVIFESPKKAEEAAENEAQTPNPSPLPDFPLTANPSTDKPLPGNPQQLNTNNIKYLNIPPIVPQEGTGRTRKKREPKEAPDWKPERFAGFWKLYPRGENKQAAIRAWDKLKPDDTVIRVMGRALKAQMASEDWQKGVGIPYASTWLNNRRWEDEVKRSAAPSQAEEPRGAYRL